MTQRRRSTTVIGSALRSDLPLHLQIGETIFGSLLPVPSPPCIPRPIPLGIHKKTSETVDDFWRPEALESQRGIEWLLRKLYRAWELLEFLEVKGERLVRQDAPKAELFPSVQPKV